MSKMDKIESCGLCRHSDSILANDLHRMCYHKGLESASFKESLIIDQSKILPNCPLEDYPTQTPCPECKKPRAHNNGILTTSCPHCGDEIPF